MALLPQAIQKLSPTGVIQRQAKCPEHDKQSSEYLGAGEKTWLFRCTALTQKGLRADHVFAARVDPTAPKTPGEVSAWLAARKAEKAGISYQ